MLSRSRMLVAAAGFVGTFPWNIKALGSWHPLHVLQERVDLHTRHYDCGSQTQPWGEWPVLTLQLGLPVLGALLALLALGVSVGRARRPAVAPALSGVATLLAVVGLGAVAVALVGADLFYGPGAKVFAVGSPRAIRGELLWALCHFVPFLALGLQPRNVWRWAAGFCVAMSVYFAVAGSTAAASRDAYEREVEAEVLRLRSGGAPKVNY